MANYVCVVARMLHFFFISSPSLAVAGKHGKRHAMPAHKPQAVSYWLNSHYLGTISAFVSIANLAKKATCLITRAI